MKFVLGLTLTVGLFAFSISAFPTNTALSLLDAVIGTSFQPKVIELEQPVATAPTAILLSWNTFGNTGNETSEPSVSNDPNVLPSSLTQGAGVTPTTNQHRFGGNNWFDVGDSSPTTLAQSVAGSDYLQFTVTPASGFSFTPTSFVFSWDHSNTGPGDLTLRSSADGFTTNLGTVLGSPAAIITSNTINISGLTSLTTATTFRLYAYGGTAAAGTGGFDVANNNVNVVLNGSVAAVSAPGISVSPTSLAFGNQPVGVTSGTQSVTVTNTGTADLVLTAPSLLNGTDFAVATNFSMPITVPPTQSTTIAFTFTPTGTGPKSDFVSINSNVPGPSPTVSLTGTGVNPGTLAFDPTSYSRAEDQSPVTVSVTRTGGTAGAVSVTYGPPSSTIARSGLLSPATGGADCSGGADYVIPNGTLAWADGDSSVKQFNVTLCADMDVEPDEFFQMQLTVPTGGATIGASTANAVIQNDDTAVQFAEVAYVEDESQSMAITVTRSGLTTGSSTVNYSIAGGTATRGDVCSGSADYASGPTGTITFDPNETTETLTIPICADLLADADETFTISLSGPTNANLGATSSTSGTIRDTASQHRFAAAIDPAVTYPATINVSNAPTNIASVRVTLYDMTIFGNAADIDVLLVGPTGASIVLMADAGAGTTLSSPTTITFSDAAGAVLPELDPINSGTYEPTTYGAAETDFAAPAPAGPYNEPRSTVGGTPSLSSVFAGTTAVGNWQLFIRTDSGAGFQRMGGGSPVINGGWGLQLLAPSAAQVSIAGRVLSAGGRAIGGAIVTVQGVDGTVRRFTTNTFGYYRVDGLAAGGTYVVSVNARRYTFPNSGRVVSLEDNVSGLDFVANR